ncbi:hypothetical protein F4779DRAFT_567586 [Xylariaceae sp. FL0662B]|nr:hypothetical protein F4779DRAFT_567586 [Xylariaceae sp. FL0662B]
MELRVDGHPILGVMNSPKPSVNSYKNHYPRPGRLSLHSLSRSTPNIHSASATPIQNSSATPNYYYHNSSLTTRQPKMQFSKITAVAIATMLSNPALACKCYVNGAQDVARTQSCCSQQGGVFQDGNDCQAASISEHLSGFRSCCGGQSDCDFPAADEAEAQ